MVTPHPSLLADANGNPLDGNNSYLLHFNKSELLPMDAFWSVTMYDAEGFQAANSINRSAIGDRDNLTYNEDGSLEIYIQLRLYSPRAEALDGTWSPQNKCRIFICPWTNVFWPRTC